MTLQWRTETASSPDGDRQVRVAGEWILRVVSDRAVRRYVSPRLTDFDAIFCADFCLRIRPRGQAIPLDRQACALGASLEIVTDVTRGVVHQVTVRIKPGDDSVARWTCSCGTSQRGSSSPDRAQEAADLHATTAPDRLPRLSDVAVAQERDGRWSPRQIRVAGRFHTTARTDFHVSDFELVVDGRMGLWTRRFGSEAQLRRDEDARGGISLLILDQA